MALIFSYPVMLFEMRHVIEHYVFGGGEYTQQRHLLINSFVIVSCTTVATLVSGVDTIFGLVGSTCSPMIVFILPSLFYLKTCSQDSLTDRMPAYMMLGMGILLIPFCTFLWVKGLVDG